MNCQESGEGLGWCWTPDKKNKENIMCLASFSASVFREAFYKLTVFYKLVFCKLLLESSVLPERLCGVNYSHRNLKNQE